MKQASRWADRLTAVCLPLSFLGPGFLNALTYPLGLHSHDTARTLIVFGLLGAAALFLLFRVLALFVKTPDLRGPLLASLLVPAVFGLVYLLALAGPADRALVLRSAVVESYHLIAAWSALILIAAEKRLRSFLRSCRACAWILTPIMLFYCVRFYLPGADYGVEDLGALDYMSLAYMLLNLCLFLMIEFFLYGDRPIRGFAVQDIALFGFFSAAITLSGCKGTMVCLSVGAVLLPLYARLAKSSRRKLCGAFPVLALSAVVLFSSVLFPDYAPESRGAAFIRELFNSPGSSIIEETDQAADILHGSGQEKTPAPPEAESPAPPEAEAPAPPEAESPAPPEAESPAPPEAEAPAPPEAESPTPPEAEAPAPSEAESPAPPEAEAPDPDSLSMIELVDYINSGQAEAALRAGQLTQEEFDLLVKAAQAISFSAIGGRTYLWSSALREIRKAPLTGQGAFFFQAEYKTYPHNLFLEIATDLGVPVMLLVLTLGLYVFARLIRASMENAVAGMLLLYVFSYLPQLLVSGTLYSYSPFFQYGFCVLLAFYFIPRVKRRDPALWEGGAPAKLPLKN